MNAVLLEDVMHTERPKDDTVKPIKEDVPIVRPNVDVECDWQKKPWMIGVQHPYPQGVRCHHRIRNLLFRFVIFMEDLCWVKKGVVIFVDLPGQL
jgi:hypothetical protein